MHRAPVITQNASACQYGGIKARSCLGEVGDLQLKNAAKKNKMWEELLGCRSVPVGGGRGRRWRTSRLSGCKLLLALQDYANWHTKVIHGWLGDTKWVLMSKNPVTPSLVIWMIQLKANYKVWQDKSSYSVDGRLKSATDVYAIRASGSLVTFWHDCWRRPTVKWRSYQQESLSEDILLWLLW